jgi:hypothetical protein
LPVPIKLLRQGAAKRVCSQDHALYTINVAEIQRNGLCPNRIASILDTPLHIFSI